MWDTDRLRWAIRRPKTLSNQSTLDEPRITQTQKAQTEVWAFLESGAGNRLQGEAITH